MVNIAAFVDTFMAGRMNIADNSYQEILDHCRSINHTVASWFSCVLGVDKRVTQLLLMQARELQPCRSCHRDRHFQRKRG